MHAEGVLWFFKTARLIVTMRQILRQPISPFVRSGLIGVAVMAANLPATVYAHDSADEKTVMVIGAVVAVMSVTVIAAIAILSERRRDRRRRRGGTGSRTQLRRSR
jgi:hypothetical protein